MSGKFNFAERLKKFSTETTGVLNSLYEALGKFVPSGLRTLTETQRREHINRFAETYRLWGILTVEFIQDVITNKDALTTENLANDLPEVLSSAPTLLHTNTTSLFPASV
ncbi:MAG: hypothetical protein ACUVTP_10080 [Candidatus Fervidibacter sp.]|uniref:hypothetical protein n=1 Tax=Candidatus Fervidibacter sp. TaxID=3100871 RepID=UPI00404A1D14